MPVTQVFINLAVSDLERSQNFFREIGFRIDASITNEQAACVVFGDTVFAMLHTADSYSRFDGRPLADPRATAAGIFALALPSREEVDDVADQALIAGGAPAREPEDHGVMYVRSFLDPDGYLWEVVWMSPEMVKGSAGPPG